MITINFVIIILQVKEVAKFHAISFCMKEGNCENLFERFPTLREDRYKDSKKSSFGRILCSLYRSDTYEFTNRTFTPILASLAELIRFFPPGRANQFPNYYPYTYQYIFLLLFCVVVQIFDYTVNCLQMYPTVCRQLWVVCWTRQKLPLSPNTNGEHSLHFHDFTVTWFLDSSFENGRF